MTHQGSPFLSVYLICFSTCVDFILSCGLSMWWKRQLLEAPISVFLDKEVKRNRSALCKYQYITSEVPYLSLNSSASAGGKEGSILPTLDVCAHLSLDRCGIKVNSSISTLTDWEGFLPRGIASPWCYQRNIRNIPALTSLGNVQNQSSLKRWK